ncbi:5'-nucleotidase domain-containing protein 1-like [Gigantopelta aegis]|uniref:5'-nucleotidase domain-containing protein 1-like n=1 Tax=Gigantopelta aegis TaxID=1735272 RepID=UPI001B88BDA0|nr:5'-nucleotidase domain-containing protein 1-like [Gigantopelta aegis]
MCAWHLYCYSFRRSVFSKSLRITTPIISIITNQRPFHSIKNDVFPLTILPAISVDKRKMTTTAIMDGTTSTTSSTPVTRKTVSLADYDAYGFDLDHTLAKYKLVEFFDMVYSCLTNFLVNKKGYDAKLKTDLQKYKDFICKGLFLDIEKGNILKLADDGSILKAVHGTKELTTSQLKSEYGDDLKWEHAETVKKLLRNQKVSWRFFENYFDTPGLVAMAQIIDILDSKADTDKADASDYSLAWQDVLDGLIEMYTFTNYAEDKGEFFPIFKKDPSKYVEACSSDIKKWLKSLKQDNKVVFLLTSSYVDFADKTLEAALGPDWATYFDINIFYARKPSYFSDTASHHILEDGKDVGPADTLKKNGFYSRGNHRDLMKFISEQTGKENPQVVYFGDNICADCYPAKMFAGWGTVLLLEEMDAEGYTCSDGTVPQHEDEGCDGQPASKKSKLPHFEHSSLVTPEEREYLTSQFWDTFLYHEDTIRPKRMNTFWGSVISEYSCITVPSLEYLAGVPLSHQFESFNAVSGNTQGFHPGRPASLLP